MVQISEVGSTSTLRWRPGLDSTSSASASSSSGYGQVSYKPFLNYIYVGFPQKKILIVSNLNFSLPSPQIVCASRNREGWQTEPCVFEVRPRGEEKSPSWLLPFSSRDVEYFITIFWVLVSSYPPLCCVSGRESRETSASLSSNFSGSWPSFLFLPIPPVLSKGETAGESGAAKNCAVFLRAPDETEAESDCSSITAQKWGRKIASICSAYTGQREKRWNPLQPGDLVQKNIFSANSRDGRGNFLAAKDEKGLHESFFSRCLVEGDNSSCHLS